MISALGFVLLFANFASSSATRHNVKVGDMILTPDQFDQLPESQKKGIEIHNENSQEQEKRNAIRDEDYRWPRGVIPYEFDDSFSTREKQRVIRAMNIWSKYTCVSFRPARRRDKNKVRLHDGDGCSANVGMVDGTQEVTLEKYGCRDVPTILHELGHTIGLYHTQSRPDRDRHLILDLSEVDQENQYNFEKKTWEHVHHYGVKYDYHSIMHYSSKDFGDENGKVIRTKNPKFQKIIGEAVILSFGDIEMVYKMYKCTPRSCKLKDSDCPGISFVDASCQCLCPGPSEAQLVQPCEGTTTGQTSQTGGNIGGTGNEDSTSPPTTPEVTETTTQEEASSTETSDHDWTPEGTMSTPESSTNSDHDWTPEGTMSTPESSTNSDHDWTPEGTMSTPESTANSDHDWTPEETMSTPDSTTNSDHDWTPEETMSTTESTTESHYY